MQAEGKAQGSAVGNALRLLAAAAGAGVLVAAIALPAVGGAGMTAKSATEELHLLPEELNEPPLAEKTTLLDVNGKPFAQFYFENRESVKLDQVADIMKTAIVSIEDFRFYEHGARASAPGTGWRWARLSRLPTLLCRRPPVKGSSVMRP